MKKVITIIGMIAFVFSMKAQDKSFRFGLKVEPSFNFIITDVTSDNGKIVLQFGGCIGILRYAIFN